MPSSDLQTPTKPSSANGARASSTVVQLTKPQSRISEFRRQGLPAIWTTGFMLICILAMLVGMLTLTLVRGLGHFWPSAVVQVETESGTFLGPVRDTEQGSAGEAGDASGDVAPERVQIRIGNRDLYGLDFRWFDVRDIQSRTQPADAVVVERQEHGNFHGYVRELRVGDRVLTGEAAWEALDDEVAAARQLFERVQDIDARYEKIRRPLTEVERALEVAKARQRAGQTVDADETAALERSVQRERTRLGPTLEPLAAERDAIFEALYAREVIVEDAGGRSKTLPLDQVVRAYRPNAMSAPRKIGHYVVKLWEFIFDEPRESNTEGGIFPALFGTVLMVLLMTIAVVPLGIIAALYLHEYAREGPVLRAVRLAVSNLAGVPSIVFGMFGLAFFVYGVGGFIDRTFYADALPTPTFGTGGILWASLTLALLTLPVVVVATEEGLSAVPRANREGSLALGATKWQTLWHVVIPQAMPGILTGVILAISRAAGEVAPLMLTGVVKLAPALAVDGEAPFVHLERKFMHLGFHIYDVSMQSPNVEAAKPMVYSTTLLLLVLVAALNIVAIVVRNRMRRRYRGAAI